MHNNILARYYEPFLLITTGLISSPETGTGSATSLPPPAADGGRGRADGYRRRHLTSLPPPAAAVRGPADSARRHPARPVPVISHAPFPGIPHAPFPASGAGEIPRPAGPDQ